jgi:hypothetical protein
VKTLSGFTIVRNARRLGYPIVESIRSILPIVDEYVVLVAASEDDTRDLVASVGDPKVRIIDTDWDMSTDRGARLLADKTNEALDLCEGVWCFYLQADEVVHQRDLPAIAAACARNQDDARVEGLLFDYVHFYGGYSVVATARWAYRREVRIVRRDAGARSVGDAQSFLIGGKRKPRVRPANARIYHYGWVHPAARMRVKRANRAELYRRPELMKNLELRPVLQRYGLRRYHDDHPAVMAAQVRAQNWTFEPRFNPRHWNARDLKCMLSDLLELVLRYRVGERRKFVVMEDDEVAAQE